MTSLNCGLTLTMLMLTVLVLIVLSGEAKAFPPSDMKSELFKRIRDLINSPTGDGEELDIAVPEEADGTIREMVSEFVGRFLNREK
ncbi:hypothetical protein E2C01_006326 [Portunus trituberculatus]|uniref:Uncharacterized protein n=1 Tax=Portunus trituberculatus TaxID=210409 RepID=A0A5B7CWK8_PORTR|nr:hypothetical protein [Portunus trituberculatus]